MNTNQQFAIWCAKKCLHLWDAPEEVKEWLNDPKEETAREAAWETRKVEQAAGTAGAAAWAAAEAAEAAEQAAWETRKAEQAAGTAGAAAWTAKAAGEALNTTEKELRLEFVSTWTDEQLATTDPDWIEFATIELMNREH